jgi:type I restriction enzyme S subunit
LDNWETIKADEIIQFNPTETIKKGTIAKKIAMEKLEPFTRDISGFELAEFKSGTKFRNGDTLLARITPCLENGKTSKVTILDEKEVAFGSTEFIVMRAKEGISDEDYIYYLSRSPYWREIAIKSMVGSSGRQRVQLDVLKNTKLSIPSLEEQREIGKILRSIDEKIENNRKINHHLAEIAKSIFDSYFIDLEPYGGNVPDDWQSSNLTGIANYLNGLAMQKYRPQSNEQGLPVLKIKELRQGFTDSTSDLCSSSIRKDYIIHDGDVIFSWSGSLLVDFWTGGGCGLNQHLFKVTSGTYDKWFYYAWTKHHLDRFIKMAADRATTMGHIKRDALEKAEVLIPSDKDYDEIGNMLKPIYDQIINNRIESRKLVALRDSLLPKLMSGEISVN